MGVIKNSKNQREFLLSTHYLIGRAPGCQLQLCDPRVSRRHAELRCHGTVWKVRDLGSLNGTFVDGRRLQPFVCRPVAPGTRLAFGDRDDIYHMIDDSPPLAFAINTSGTRVQSKDGMFCLPDPTAPLCIVYSEEGRWYAESMGKPKLPLENGDTLEIGGESWVFDLPIVSQTTESKGREWLLEDLTLRFAVSRDSEHVDLELDDDTERLLLPSRVYWYTMLVLASRRLSDQAQGIGDADQGWIHVEDLYREFKDSPDPADVLNHHVYRAKKTFRQFGVRDFADLIERRPGSKQIRLGVRKLEIRSA
jgi:hypothetical protein